MHISDELVETVMGICLWTLPVIMVAGAAWPILLPPRKIRSLPYFTRPFLGAFTALVAAYAFLLIIVRPLINAQFEAHHGNIILDYPIDMLPSSFIVIGAVLISSALFGIHASCRAFFGRVHETR